MDSLHWLVTQRRNGLLARNDFARRTRDSAYLVKRLAKTRVFEGHSGCVNSVSWNEMGTRLISGSDDCHLNIYDTATGFKCHSFHTTHQSNIFSAKFLPESGDCKAVSCAGIGSVEVSEITPYGEYVPHPFKCQTSITYQVGTIPGSPHEFLTCEERGMVRMYDLRTCSSCLCDGDCDRSVMCRFPDAITSMAVHPLEPHYMAVGLGDGTIRLLDRRRVKHWPDTGGIAEPCLPLFLGASCALVKYRPSALKNDKLKITSLNFNHNGSEILASYSEDYVYLFNCGLYGAGPDITLTPRRITKPQYLSQCERYPGCRRRRNRVTVPKTRMNGIRCSPCDVADSSNTEMTSSSYRPSSTSSSQGAAGGVRRSGEGVSPAVKRIRLRGDWSDTGPEARPESQSEPVEGGSLMNRMSRMFARWVDMSLDNVSGEEREGEGEGRDGEERGRDSDREEGSSDASFHLFSSESDANSERLADSDGEESASGDGSQHNDIRDNENLDRDIEDTVQEATERAMHDAVQEATERAMHDAVQEATERAMHDAVQAETERAMHDAVQEATERAMHDAVQEAVDRAIDRAMDAVADNDTDKTTDGTADGATDSTADSVMEDAMDRSTVDNVVDLTIEQDARSTSTSVLDIVTGRTTADGTEATSSTLTDESEKKCSTSLAANTRSNASVQPVMSEGGVPHHSPVTSAAPQNRSTPSSPPSPPCQPYVKEHPSEVSRDRSCDKSHDHSYRRSRFKVQRKHEERSREEEEEEGGREKRDERRFAELTAEEREGEYKGYWEESVDESERLMRESARSVQNHLQPFMVYKGHRNSRTMIKQANFFGDDWVMSGSDCGRVFLWDKWTGEVVNMFTADSHVVNCVQPHPTAHMIATSGIDYNVKLWEPVGSEEASLTDLDEVMRRNEQMLRESRNTITIPSSFLLRILTYLNRRGRARPPSDQQPSHNDSD